MAIDGYEYHLANQTVILNTDTNSTGGGSAGDLRYAIANVGDGEEITFNISQYDSTQNNILKINAELNISDSGTNPLGAKSITIDGYNNATSDNVIVQVTAPGASNYRAFNINASGETIALVNMTIRGGNIGSNYGAGINIASGTTGALNNITVSSSYAARGGGIHNAGILTVTNSTVGGTDIDKGNDASEFGGGIYNAGTLTISKSLICNNEAAGSTASDADGGGIYNTGSLTLSNSTFFGNESHNDGGGFYLASGTATLDSVTIAANKADSDGSGSGGDGGGLCLNGDTLTVKNTIIANNYNNSSQVDDYFYQAGTLTDNGYNFVENQNTTTSGQGFQVTNNVLNTDPTGFGNTLEDTGGYTKAIRVTIGNLTTGDYAANTDNTGDPNSTDQRGHYRTDNVHTRGAYQYNGIVAKIGMDTSWTESTNTFTTIQAAVTSVDEDSTIFLAATSIYEGGGVFIGTSGTAYTYSITIQGETADETSTTVRSGANRPFYVNAATNTVNIKYMTIWGGSVASGAGIDNAAGTLNLDSVRIQGGVASAKGGGIYNAATANLSIDNCTISGNSAALSGGGIYSSNELTISNSTISNNTATDGGGFFLKPTNGAFSGSTITSSITNSTISGNTAEEQGGGIDHSIFAEDKTSILNISNSTISGNLAKENGTASLAGGGIFNRSSDYDVTGYYSSVILNIDNCTISGNQTETRPGGGIANVGYQEYSTAAININNSTISDNVASYTSHASFVAGGGIYNLNQHAIAQIVNTTFAGNWVGGAAPDSVLAANGHGGGIYNTNGEVYLVNSIVVNNKTGNTGSDNVYNSAGTTNAYYSWLPAGTYTNISLGGSGN